MTCQFRITIPKGGIDLTSPMDWFACHAVILAQMGIKDAGPVLTEAEAVKVADKALRAHQAAESLRNSGGKSR